MPFTRSGKHYTIRAKRYCKNCKETTQQSTVTLKYRKPAESTVPASYLKEYTWFCEQCSELEIETKTIYEPTDKAMIFNRLLKLAEDYDVLKMSIESRPDEILLRIKLPNFDMGEIRAIKSKAEQTGFIRVDELMRLQKAGFQRPVEVSPKPQPRDRRTLRERARERMFLSEPRSRSL